MKTLINDLERHSQIESAKSATGVLIRWKNGGTSLMSINQAEAWISNHPPRCWSWLRSPATNTDRDYCKLNLDHRGPHVGDREVW